MGKLRWYKRDPDAALAGMMVLTLEERGAYNTVLDLIYANEGSVHDDPRFISGWLRCDVRVWKRIRERLIGLEKLYVENGQLRNGRADAEVDRGLLRIASASEAGKASARSKADAKSKNNDLASTGVERQFQLSTTTTTKKESKKIRADARDGENVSRRTSQPDPVESPSDLTASTEPTERLLPPPESARPPPRYVFESGIIRLNQTNLDNWIKAFSYLDLRAELFSLTEWAQAQGPDRWFPAVSGALAKRNREVKIRIEREKTNPDPRKGTPFEAFA